MTLNLAFEKTERGFGYWGFNDRYKHPAMIQESSLATEAAIWFGCDDGGRMHLTQDMVKELLPILQHFAETGELLTELPAEPEDGQI